MDKIILVVADFAGIRTFIHKALEKKSYNVLLANNGFDGV